MPRPGREGYLAILFPTTQELRELQRDLVSLEQYMACRAVTADDLR